MMIELVWNAFVYQNDDGEQCFEMCKAPNCEIQTENTLKMYCCIRSAKAAGWLLTDGWWYCPECADRPKEEA